MVYFMLLPSQPQHLLDRLLLDLDRHYYIQPNIHYEQEELCCVCTLHRSSNRILNFVQKDNVHTTKDTLPWSLQTNPLHLSLQCLHDLVSQWPILDSLPYLSLRTEKCHELSAGCNARITRKRCEFILYWEMEQLWVPTSSLFQQL